MTFKGPKVPQKTVVNVPWKHRLKLLWTGKLVILASRSKNTPSGVTIDAVAV